MALKKHGSQNKIIKILGSCNCIVIVPDGYAYDKKDNLLTSFAKSFVTTIDAYAVINCKYKKTIIDLNNIESVTNNQRINNEFLNPLYNFKAEIQGNSQPPLCLIFEMYSSDHPSHLQPDIILGTGQGERGNPTRSQHTTFPPSLLTKLRVSLSDAGFTTELASVDSQLCGREKNCLNQLFFQKENDTDSSHPDCYSLSFNFSPGSLGINSKNAIAKGRQMAERLSHFIVEMPLVRQVPIKSIKTESANDKKYIFRVNNEDNSMQSLIREGYIEELAESIRQSGLLHPLVLLQKDDGNYKILCGFRRYQALTKLDKKWVEAKIYKEDTFSREEFFNISLAENTRRKNLNPVEVGNFLESAAQELGLNNALLAEKFGKTLGIGKPNTNVSQSTIHKYRKVNAIRARKESPDIISDIVNGRLQFTIAAEILAPIKNPEHRNCFYFNIIKTLTPTRAQIIKIKHLLDEFQAPIPEILARDKIKKSLNKALQQEQPAIHFIKTLQKTQLLPPKKTINKRLQKKTRELQAVIKGSSLKHSDLRLIPSTTKTKEEVTLQIKIRPDNANEALQVLSNIDAHKQQIYELFNN